MMDNTALYAIDHPYYCNRGSYYATALDQPYQEYEAWADFLAEEGDSDMDMNLVFRWDWKEEDEEGNPSFKGDVNERNGTLFLFIIGQRKGLYRWVEVKVCRADNDAVRAYLEPRWEHMKKLWAPLT